MSNRLIFVHFVIDDKFINDSIECFTRSDLVENLFVIVSKKNRDLKYVAKEKIRQVRPECVLDFIADNHANVVCLHSLMSIPYHIISKIPAIVKVLWFAWGFDLYSNPKPTGPFLNIGNRYLPKTEKLIKIDNIRRCISSELILLIKKIIGEKLTSKVVFDAMNRVDFFSGVFPEEYAMLKDTYPDFRAQQIVHNYIHPQEFNAEDLHDPLSITGHNILLGNSAAYIINHVDIMYKIKDLVPDNTKIITPLSYQGSPRYVQKVINKGKNMFGDKFVPLCGYLPFNEYTQIMNSCDTIILGQKQQAATCNCLTAMWNGLKLYLPKDSMNYKFYSSMGMKVFSIDEYNPNDKISYEDVISNRIIIERSYSYRSWEDDLKNTIQLINNS